MARGAVGKDHNKGRERTNIVENLQIFRKPVKQLPNERPKRIFSRGSVENADFEV